jgi:hypothetical protein
LSDEPLPSESAFFDEPRNAAVKPCAKHLSTAQISKLDARYQRYLKSVLKQKLSLMKTIDSDDIPQPVDLNLLFHEWCSMKDELDESFLFRNLAIDDQGLLLGEARWNFESKAFVRSLFHTLCLPSRTSTTFLDHADQAEAVYEEDKGVPQGGGLTRVFLNSVWSQIHLLSIHVNGKQIPLFEFHDNDAVVPLTDDHLRHCVAKCLQINADVLDKDNEAVKAVDLAKHYYRAIGRLMIHSLATGHVLPSHVMPPFYRACK